jgi:1-acyl-sn-glycerol-3-phosphate acyltransferase
MRFHYHFLHVLVRPFFSSLFKFQVFGAKNIPNNGGVLLMTNHVSFVDPIFLGAAVNRNLRYMARSTLFKPGIIEWFLLNMSAFPVNRGAPDRRAIRQALKFLEDGELLNIFPEGTRSHDGNTLGKALAGVGFIAYKTSAPVVPVFLSGTQHVLPRKAKIPKLAKVAVYFGKRLDMDQYRKDKASRETYERIGEDVMARIAELKKEAEGIKG